jgi:hypothetical protein
MAALGARGFTDGRRHPDDDPAGRALVEMQQHAVLGVERATSQMISARTANFQQR